MQHIAVLEEAGDIVNTHCACCDQDFQLNVAFRA